MYYSRLLKKAKNKDAVFVDFFDTVMFRSAHSHQLMPQWEKALKLKYPELEETPLSHIRKEAITSLGGDECAIKYDKLLRKIYDCIGTKVGFKEFYHVSYLIDYSIDMITQYPNKKIINTLKKLKEKGKKIYLVTDYYLPADCYTHYLKPYNLIELFDEIFCSSEYERTKSNGNLYPFILEKLNISSHKVVMIGDSKQSDYINASMHGIEGVRYFPLKHKILTNYRKKTGYDFKKYGLNQFYKNTFKNTLFCEYALNLYYFTQKLLQEVKTHGESNVGFLARGGYFLKICFDRCKLLNSDFNVINSYYIKNSRKVNKKALVNDNDKKMLSQYMSYFSKNNSMTVVDEGWYCSSQITIEKVTGIRVNGYYLGIMDRNKGEENFTRKGILFDINESGDKSPYYGVFRTNCTFYEQLLSAPHGSTTEYHEINGKIQAKEVWNDVEKKNYYENILPLQENILDYLTGLVTWNCNLGLDELSKYVMHTLLFGSNERLIKMDEIMNAWFDNANDTNEKKFANIRNVKISVVELIAAPENYLRYFCKLKDLKLRSNWMKFIYPVLGPCIYLYCRSSINIKKRIYGWD